MTERTRVLETGICRSCGEEAELYAPLPGKRHSGITGRCRQCVNRIVGTLHKKQNAASRDDAVKHAQAWTTADIEFLTETYLDNEPLPEIARALGRTLGACRMQLMKTRCLKGGDAAKT